MIELRGAAIGYGERPVVREANLRVDRGEVVALVGPNGSGKTTVVRGILGLAPIMAGEVRLFGTPAADFGERWRIGYVPQRHTVVGAVPSTVAEVVGSGRLPRKRLFSRTSAADRTAVAEAIDLVGLAERRTAPVSTLSGGQQRRVLIARALASEPEVLIMDEPTAGVDAENQARLGRTLDRLVTHGLTLLVVTHDIAPLRSVLTRAVVMQDGRVIGDLPAAAAFGIDLGAGPDAHHPVAAPGWLGGLGLRG
ncbi:MAG: metal ABC transporter ATP-binding protein [Kineosporiaceae bacterium]